MSVPRMEWSDSDPALADLLEEIAGRMQAGEPIDPEAVAREHPELAGSLRRVLPAIEALVKLGAASSSESPASFARLLDVPAPGPVLGDFRIVREVGRGGMGVVYEAHQVSLDRRVALKVLPIAAAIDARQLQRFQIEARAAALLHHTHIVPVYSVGCEQGVHYYAMQFIEGRTLAAVIGELQHDPGQHAVRRTDAEPPISTARPAAVSPVPDGSPSVADVSPVSAIGASDSPDSREGAPSGTHIQGPPALSGSSAGRRAYFKTAAELGLQAAEALEHAHQSGVVHRDVKPANLLVDFEGRLWITDFGLARLQRESNLSRTGELLGTVRYMSPEQVRGRPGTVDHRTDIYSLGATLYELLTLRPPFDRDERQHLLRQILEDEPTPPRRLDRAIPDDLATIVMKAMAKAPEDRYPTAQDLADDLRRFLEVRPIRARRPTFIQKAAKWSRRHQPIVWSAAAVLALAVVALSVSNVLIRREERDKEHALIQRGVALGQAQSSARRAEIEAERARSTSELLQEMLASADPDRARGAGYTVRELLDDFSGRLDRRQDLEPEVEASLRRSIGIAYRRLGLADRARPHLDRALALARQAFGARHERVAESLVDRAWSLAAAGRLDDAYRDILEALAIHDANAEHGAPRVASLWALVWLEVYRGRHAQAEAAGREALALVRAGSAAECPEVASLLHTLADSNNDRRQFSEAERLARESVTLHQRLHGPHHPETGWGYNALARALLGQGRAVESATAYRTALAIFRRQYDARHKSVSQALRGLADASRSLGDRAGLEAVLREALAAEEGAVTREPESPEARLRRGLALASWDEWDRAAADARFAFGSRERIPAPSRRDLVGLLGRLAERNLLLGRPGPAEEELRAAVTLLEEAAAAALDQPGDTLRLVKYRLDLAELLDSGTRSEEAERATREALAGLRSAAPSRPDEDAMRLEVSMASARLLALVTRRLSPGDSASRLEADQLLADALVYCPANATARNNLAWILVRRTPVWPEVARAAVDLSQQAVAAEPEAGYIRNTLGVAQLRAGAVDQAAGSLREALKQMGEDSFAHNGFFLAQAVHCLGDASEAQDWYERSVKWMDRHARADRELHEVCLETERLLGREPHREDDRSAASR